MRKMSRSLDDIVPMHSTNVTSARSLSDAAKHLNSIQARPESRSEKYSRVHRETDAYWKKKGWKK